MKNTFLLTFIIALILSSGAYSSDFGTKNTFDVNDGYFHEANQVPEYYRPASINPLMAMLPEYSMFGPGFICDYRQAPPVYRLPMQYNRNIGYREADWLNNHILDRRGLPVNFGGWNY
ncbi:MAG: hypothetical protein ACK481_04695 [Candidatus Melainabacteria bacterium]|jgi:hypothetical protein